MTDALAAIVRNRSADFPWAFTALFLLFVTAMTAVLARDGVPRDHPPVLVTGTLTVFWFGGLGFAAFASARQCLVVRVLPHANVSIVRRCPFRRREPIVSRGQLAPVAAMETADDEGEPCLRARLVMRGDRPSDLAEGHDRSACEAVGARLDAAQWRSPPGKGAA